MVFHLRNIDEKITDVGGLALGYNVTLSKSIELINQLCLDLPQQNEPVAVGLMIGFIATLPTSR